MKKSENYQIVRIFFEKVIELKRSQANYDAKKISGILSSKTIDSMKTAIKELDCKLNCGTVCCDKCSFSELRKDEEFCPFIHKGCLSWI